MTTHMTGTREPMEVPATILQRKAADGPLTGRISGAEILAAWGLAGLIALGVVAADFAFPPDGGPAITSASTADPAAVGWASVVRDEFENQGDRSATLAGTDISLPAAVAGNETAKPRASTVRPVSQHAHVRRRPVGSEANARSNGNS